MQKNAILVTVFSLIAIFGFLFLVYSFSNNPSNQGGQEFPQVNKVEANDHTKWSSKKKVLLVEYADLQCPACKQFHAILTQFEKGPDAQISKDTTFIFRHFPLTGHQNAVPAARAAEAAGRQGKFFEMSDLLYNEQESWADLGNPTDYFVNLAKKLKLDIEKFNTDLKVAEVQKKIDADTASGYAAQVNSTPTFFLNGKKIEVETIDQFKNLLKNAVK